MISQQELTGIARDRNLPLDMVEKDYILGWVLYGISQSSISNEIVFKGGTALSKVYFPGNWRLSEDLDYSPINEPNWEKTKNAVINELPEILKPTQIAIRVKEKIFERENFLRIKPRYIGPIEGGMIKVEIKKEEHIGDIIDAKIPQDYDYPDFSVKVYSLENIFAEKLRAIIERGKIRDYYDVWRLLKEERIKDPNAELFLKKCKGKKIEYSGIEQFFDEEKIVELPKHLENVTRMTSDTIDLDQILDELKTELGKVDGL